MKIDFIDLNTGNHLEEAVMIDDDGNVDCFLFARGGNKKIKVIDGVPIFSGNQYADSFAYQWVTFQQTQLDSNNSDDDTRKRFFSHTGLVPSDLQGKTVLEAGCGAGRYSEVLLDYCGYLFSFDISESVLIANKNNHGKNEKCKFFQASIYDIPFKKEQFDVVYCVGVLQHTPDPKAAFLQLVRQLKPGGASHNRHLRQRREGRSL